MSELFRAEVAEVQPKRVVVRLAFASAEVRRLGAPPNGSLCQADSRMLASVPVDETHVSVKSTSTHGVVGPLPTTARAENVRFRS